MDNLTLQILHYKFLAYASKNSIFLVKFSTVSIERGLNPSETVWRSPVLRSPDCVRHRWARAGGGHQTCPPLLSAEILHSRWASHGLTQAPGARPDRFVRTQSRRTVASHSNCISAHRGGGKSPVVHITVAEANLAEIEGEMEKPHLLH